MEFLYQKKRRNAIIGAVLAIGTLIADRVFNLELSKAIPGFEAMVGLSIIGSIQWFAAGVTDRNTREVIAQKDQFDIKRVHELADLLRQNADRGTTQTGSGNAPTDGSGNG